MSENVEERRNMFYNPLFKKTGQQATGFDSCTLDYRGDGTLGMLPVSDASSGGYAVFNAPVTPGGAYVFSFSMQCASGVYPVTDIRTGHMLSIRTATSMTDTGGTVNIVELGAPDHEGAYTARFTVPTGVPFVSIYLRGSQSQNVTFSNPQLELASTYDTAVAAGGKEYPVLFNGSTLPE